MARKRKAEETPEAEEGDTGEGPSQQGGKKGKKATWNAKEEKSADVLKRLESDGIEYRDEQEAGLPSVSGAVQDQQWIEVLAQHLVREPQYLKMMQNPPEVETMSFASAWVANVHLPGRYRRFNNHKQFWSKWFPNHKVAILDRAFAILDAAEQIVQTSIGKTRIPPPPDNKEADDARQDIFFFQTLRSRVLSALQEGTDMEQALMKRLLSLSPSSSNAEVSADSAQAFEELNLLEDMIQELRVTLASCTTNSEGKRIIDDLIMAVPQQSSNLFLVSQNAATVLSTADGEDDEGDPQDTSNPLPLGQATSIEDQKVAQTLAKIHQQAYTLHFYDPATAAKTVPITTQAPRSQISIDMDEEPQIDHLHTTGTLPELDTRVAAVLSQHGQSIDHGRFQVNLLHFEAVSDRPQLVKDAKKAGAVFTNASARLVLVEDNLFHVKSLISQIREHAMLADGVTDDQLQKALRRLWALVAIMWGCELEGSLWLTVMDALLEDLAQLVSGQADAHLATATMQRFQQMRTGTATTPSDTIALSSTEIAKLERQDRARQVFAELARFYRGAVLLSYTGVSRGQNLTVESGAKWYENLLRWSYICGAESCIEKLQVRKFEKEGEGKETAKRSELGLRSKYGVTIGVEDARMGFPEERAEISKNREWAYPCLYDIIHFSRWHPGFGPFFHYFGHLYHPACQPARGKDVFVLTLMTATAGR